MRISHAVFAAERELPQLNVQGDSRECCTKMGHVFFLMRYLIHEQLPRSDRVKKGWNAKRPLKVAYLTHLALFAAVQVPRGVAVAALGAKLAIRARREVTASVAVPNSAGVASSRGFNWNWDIELFSIKERTSHQ